MLITRRRLLTLGAGASLLPACSALAQEAVSDHLLGRNSDYADYARIGPFAYTDRPDFTTLKEGRIQVAVMVSPEATQPRLVVFSHGALTEPLLYRYLLNHWVSHGYMVVAPVHDDSVIEEGLSIRHQDARGATRWDFSGLLNDHGLWSQRADACNAVLDEVETLARTFEVDIQADRPIIAGHSYGAFTAQLLLGTSVNTAAGIRDFHDPRWAGGILMSPQGIGIMGLHRESWKDVTRPLLVMTGGRDVDASEQDASRKADPFWHSPEGYKHFAYMAQGTHTSFTGQSARPGNYDQRLFDDIKATTVAFLKAYADHDVVAYGHLQDDYLSVHTIERADPALGQERHSRLYMQSR